MLRDRSKKRLATSGFAGVFLPEIRIYAYPRQNGILLRNIPTAKGVLKLWLFSKRTSTDIGNPTPDNPILDFPIPDYPMSENPMQLNKDILNTDLQNIYSFPFLSFSPSLWLRNSKATRMER
jgi:hypothetical protein